MAQSLNGYPYIPGVRGELLFKLQRYDACAISSWMAKTSVSSRS